MFWLVFALFVCFFNTVNALYQTAKPLKFGSNNESIFSERFFSAVRMKA